MPRRVSKADGLPREILEELYQRFREHRFTTDELLALIRQVKPDADISRTGLARHLKKYEGTFNRIQVAQEAAARCLAQWKENPRGDIGRLLTETVGALAMNTVDEMGEEGKEAPGSQDLYFLAYACKNLAHAAKLDVDRELKVRAQIAAEVKKKVDAAGEAVAEVARAGGLSDDAEQQIRNALLGIAPNV